MNVAVVVAGELARSPRMVNHARTLALAGYKVSLIGYAGRQFETPPEVAVVVVPIPERAAEWSLAGAGLRMAAVFVRLLVAMFREKPRTILVQNPPSFPTLPAAWIAARILRARLVIDWHNYGYSMLALRPGAGGAVSRAARHFEQWMGRRTDSHFCVSETMRRDLAESFGIHAMILRDRPVRFGGSAVPSDARPLVAVCPAGWAADEAMDMLLDSLESLHLRNIEVHLTGEGPALGVLAPRIAALAEAGLSVHTGFLSESEYWALIRRADVGISMHRSSSGLDLAMKVVDLFGAGVPVCALDYGETVREQIQPGETGFLFRSAKELTDILERLQSDPPTLAAMRRAAGERWNVTWQEEWTRVAEPVFRGTE